MQVDLDFIIKKLEGKSEEEIRELVEASGFADKHFTPNPGPQTAAYLCQADELYYGGSAGCGKTALGCGLAINNHKRSIIFRREFPQLKGIEDELASLIGTRDGYNSQTKTWRIPNSDKVVELGAVQHEWDKEKYQGRAHDLKFFDEITHFLKSQYLFLIGWLRSDDPDQRCRVVCAGNPPMTAEGLWVIEHWGAWLDPNHHNPAKPGELRWYTTGEDGKEIEVDGRGPHIINGREVFARSRTFIPGKLEDNPYLLETGYAATLDAMPEPYRTMLREGRFDLSMQDQDFQLIPTAWIREAQARWKPEPYPGVPMCAMGVDVARGGADNTVIASRYDGWYAPLIVKPGVETPDGNTVAGLVVAERRDAAHVVIDMGGGYGGAPLEHLNLTLGNGFVSGYVGSSKGYGRSDDRQLGFYNKRSEVWWRFREALDPSQPLGSPIALPDDPALVADLTAPTFEISGGNIKVEPKEKLVKRLGRSPDRGDAVVMAWHEGDKGLATYEEYNVPEYRRPHALKSAGVKVNVGYANRRRK